MVQPIWDAIALAAQLWCRDDTEQFVMDEKLANEFADRIRTFEHQLAVELMAKCKRC